MGACVKTAGPPSISYRSYGKMGIQRWDKWWLWRENKSCKGGYCVITELVAVNKNNMTFAAVFRGEHTVRSVFFCGKKMRRACHWATTSLWKIEEKPTKCYLIWSVDFLIYRRRHNNSCWRSSKWCVRSGRKMDFIMSRVHTKWVLLRRRACLRVWLRVSTYMFKAQVLRTCIRTYLPTMYTRQYHQSMAGWDCWLYWAQYPPIMQASVCVSAAKPAKQNLSAIKKSCR